MSTSPGTLCKDKQLLKILRVYRINCCYLMLQNKSVGGKAGSGCTVSLLLLLRELLVEQLLLGQLRLLVDLDQHLIHHAEQRTAQAQQLQQEHIVTWVAPDVGPHSRHRLTHASHQPARQHTHSPTSTPRPAQTSPEQGNQGTCGLDSARGGKGPAGQRRGIYVVILKTKQKVQEMTQNSLKQQEKNQIHFKTYKIVCFACND